VPPARVVEALDVVEDGAPGLPSVHPHVPVDQLALETILTTVGYTAAFIAAAIRIFRWE